MCSLREVTELLIGSGVRWIYAAAMQRIPLHRGPESDVMEAPTTFLLGGNPPGNPFAILRSVQEVPVGSAVRLELRGSIGSIEVAHAVSIWRVCVSRGVRLTSVVFSESAFKSMSILGLVRMLGVVLCPQAQRGRPTCEYHPTDVPHCPHGGSCLATP